jgi:hypothetical protein
LSPGSVALRWSIITPSSLAASAMSMAPTRSPPSPACSMTSVSVPLPSRPLGQDLVATHKAPLPATAARRRAP